MARKFPKSLLIGEANLTLDRKNLLSNAGLWFCQGLLRRSTGLMVVPRLASLMARLMSLKS